jgi:hypothetical protein
MKDEQLDKLFQAARSARLDTSRAEYGFETRLLALLRADREQPAPWYALAWKLVPAFAAIVVALGLWTAAEPGLGSNDLGGAITGDRQENTLVTYLTGESQ